MGGFLLLPKTSRAYRQGRLPLAREQFGKSGLDGRESIETEAFVFDHYRKIGFDSHNLLRLGPNDFIASIGTFIFAGQIGIAALRAFAAEPDHDRARASAYGHFVLVICRAGEVRILGDALGAHPIYHDAERTVVTSSFLAAARLAAKLTLGAHEVYEYVFNGVTLGETTVFSEIRRLAGDRSLRLADGLTIVPSPVPVVEPEAPLGRDASLSRSFEVLSRYLGALGGIFGSNIRMALSGGYDSRLLLALFRSQSISPSLFVYGGKTDPDVVIAERIAAGEGFDLRHVDKAQRRPTPDEMPGIVARNFDIDDGLPWCGIITTDAEYRARIERSAGGALHVNGGGGEVFRNYFRFDDRPISARELVWSFYCQIDPAICTDRFSRVAYVAAVAEKVSDTLQDRSRRIARRRIESLYPNMRCRSWFGRENSINSRFGYSVLPFYDFQIVQRALQVPIAYKHVGDYEAALIRMADPRLAAYPTNYGHDFAADAPWRRQLGERLSYRWPPRLRQYHHALKARLHTPAAQPPALQPDILRTLIAPSAPYMARFFKLAEIRSTTQLERIYSLEYVCQQLNPAET